MEEKSKINNYFQISSSFSKEPQDNTRNKKNNQSIISKQKSTNNNSNQIIFNNFCHSQRTLLSSTNQSFSNKMNYAFENNRDASIDINNLVNEEGKEKNPSCTAKYINNNKNINNAHELYKNRDEKEIKEKVSRDNKNSSIKNKFIKNDNNNKFNDKKNKDNNTKIYDEPFIDEFENLQFNNEDMDEKKENISIKKLSSKESINNIKNINIKNNYFINGKNINKNDNINNNIKKSSVKFDNNEIYEEKKNNNNNNNYVEINKKIKLEKINKNNNNYEKIKNRNLSCRRIKKKKIISISSFGYPGENSKEEDEIILFENGLGVNDCFLNAIIQVLFHLEEFKKKFFQLRVSQDPKNPIYQLNVIIHNYETLSKLNSNNTLNASLLRESLHCKFGTYEKGKCGDPMETFSQLLDLIHTQFFQANSDKNKNSINNNSCQNDLCPSHSNFLLYLKEIKYCPECKTRKKQMYDKDCFMYDVLSCEILSLLKNETFKSYKYSLFKKLKQLSQSFGDHKQKLEKCKCKEINTIKKLYLYNKFSPYLIINITWDTDFPLMGDICKIYGLIPSFDDNKNLFEIDFEKGQKNEKELFTNYYLHSMILYGQNHYTCFFYNTIIEKWSFVDDDSKKNFNTYHELINYLIIRRSIPVGIIFYHSNTFNLEKKDKFKLDEKEFEKLYQRSVINDQRDIEEKKNEERLKNMQKIYNENSFKKKNIHNYENMKNYNKNLNSNKDNYDDEEIIKIKRKKK